MNKFLAVITSEQFDTLYRFGKLYHPVFLTSDKSNEEHLVNIFNEFIQFVYDENYLILEYTFQDLGDKPYHLIKIETVERVFPISNECREALILKKSTQIKFQPPIFSQTNYDKINNHYFITEAINGSKILLKVFHFNFEPNYFTNEIKSAILKRRSGLKISRLDNNSALIDFCFLYVYEAFYPLNDIGYLIRTVEILTRFKLAEQNKKYVPVILEKRGIYQMLMELNLEQSTITFDMLLDILPKDPKTTSFIQHLVIQDIRYYFVIPLFLKIVDEFNENGGSLSKTNLTIIIQNYKLMYKEECKILLIWLGSYLGYGNCYDFCYSKMNFKFFNTYQDIQSIQNDVAKLSNDEKFDSGLNNSETLLNAVENSLNGELIQKNINLLNTNINNEIDENEVKLESIPENDLAQFQIVEQSDSNLSEQENSGILNVNNLDDKKVPIKNHLVKEILEKDSNSNVEKNHEINTPFEIKNEEIEVGIEQHKHDAFNSSATKISDFQIFDQLKFSKSKLSYLKSIWENEHNSNLDYNEKKMFFVAKIKDDFSSSKKTKLKYDDLEKIESLLLKGEKQD